MSRMQASTINQIGQRPLRVLPQLSGPMLAAMQHRARRYGIGDGATDLMQSGLASAGDVATAQALGATDAQLEAVAQGQMNFPALMNILTGSAAPGSTNVPLPAALQPSSTPIATGVNAVTPASTTAPASTALPAGTQLMYQVTWTSSITNLYTPSMIAGSITATLQGNQITILNETDAPSTSTFGVPGQGLGFTLTISLGTAYASVAQVKAIIDGAITAAGRSIVASNLVPIAPGAGLPNQAALAWLEANAGSIAALLLVLAIVPVVIRKF